jgi:hypothetical protein
MGQATLRSSDAEMGDELLSERCRHRIRPGRCLFLLEFWGLAQSSLAELSRPHPRNDKSRGWGRESSARLASERQDSN